MLSLSTVTKNRIAFLFHLCEDATSDREGKLCHQKVDKLDPEEISQGVKCSKINEDLSSDLRHPRKNVMCMSLTTGQGGE